MAGCHLSTLRKGLQAWKLQVRPRAPTGDQGYTPFEYIQFSEDEIVHEIVTHVEAPVATCFAHWKERLNWLEWFDITI